MYSLGESSSTDARYRIGAANRHGTIRAENMLLGNIRTANTYSRNGSRVR